MRAVIIGTVDQQAANAGGAHLCEGYLLLGRHQLPSRYVPQLCRLYLAASLILEPSARVRLVRVPRVVEKALIGALLVASIAWGFLYNFVLGDNPQPMQMQPSAQFIGGTVGRR